MSVTLKKGNSISLTKELKSNKFVLGAGWDSQFDLDLSLIPKFPGSIELNMVTCFRTLKTVYAQHSGDNRTGEGDGDDETITIDLDKVPTTINTVFASVYCYSEGTFGSVDGEFFKLYDSQGNVKVEVKMDEVQASNNATHLTAVKFARAGSEWNVEFVGRYDVIPNHSIESAVQLVQKI